MRRVGVVVATVGLVLAGSVAILYLYLLQTAHTAPGGL
jgi:hypothetical protein